MLNLRCGWLAPVAFAVVMVAARAGFAQTVAAPPAAGPQSVSQIPTIVVHISPLMGAGVEIARWPHPVEFFGRREIAAEGVADATGALDRKAAGVNIQNSQANPYQPTILFHGFEISPIQGTPAGLSVYVNGARFNQPFGDLAIWSVLPDEAISTISLQDGNPVYGLNALGGAVDVQMKDGFTAPGGEAEISGGSFGKIEGNLEYGKQAGNGAVYVDLGETHEAGWRDLQSSDIQNFYGDVGWRGATSELHFNVTLADSNLNGPGSVPVQILNADSAAQFTGPNRIADKYAKTSVSLTHQLTQDISFDATFYYDYLHEYLANGNGPNDLPCAPHAAYLCEGGPGNNVSTTLGGAPIPDFLPDADAYGYYSYSQLNLNSTNTNGYGGIFQISDTAAFAGLQSRLVAGLSYDGGFTNYGAQGYVGGITQGSRIFYTPAGIPSPGYELDEAGTVPVNVVIRNAYYGAYLSETLSLTPKLAVTAGGRFNIANSALRDQLPPDPNAAGGGLTGRHYYRHANPSIGATYTLFPELTIFTSFSEENAAPTPAELSCASPADSCSLANFQSGDPDLKQVVTRAFEGGLRGAVAGPLASIIGYSLDYYNTVTNDDIEFLQSPFNPVGDGYFSNVGNVARNGFDAGITVAIRHVHAYFNYSRTNATFQSTFIEQSNNPNMDANGNITVRPGDHVPGIPSNIFKFGALWQATPAWQIGLSATAQTFTYLYGDEANLTLPLPGYLVADVNTSYRFTPRVQGFITVSNITGARYYNYGTFSPVGQDGGVYVAQAPDYSNPRSYSKAAPTGAFAGVKLTW